MYIPCTYSVDPQNKSVTFKDTDLTEADPQVKAVANLQWTEANVKTWKDIISKPLKKNGKIFGPEKKLTLLFLIKVKKNSIV